MSNVRVVLIIPVVLAVGGRVWCPYAMSGWQWQQQLASRHLEWCDIVLETGAVDDRRSCATGRSIRRNWAHSGALKRRPEPREVADVNIERRSSPLAVNTVPTEANLNRN